MALAAIQNPLNGNHALLFRISVLGDDKRCLTVERRALNTGAVNVYTDYNKNSQHVKQPSDIGIAYFNGLVCFLYCDVPKELNTDADAVLVFPRLGFMASQPSKRMKLTSTLSRN
jgi:hypothetical protein